MQPTPAPRQSRETSRLTVVALLGLIPAYIASQKGETFGYWWLFGMALWIVALPVALVMRPNTTAIDRRQGTRPCPWCAESIKQEARVCRFCQREVERVGD